MALRNIQASQARAQLPRLLDEVERGGTIIITRRGRPIARLVPEAARNRDQIRTAIEEIKAFRGRMPQLSAGDVRKLINEDRKY